MIESDQRQSIDLLIKNGQIVTAGGHTGPVAGSKMQELTVLERGFVAIAGEQIIALGSLEEILAQARLTEKTQEIDALGKVVTPGLIDAHTHLIFGGSREDEFVMRIQGSSYLEILKAGGGILNTVEATKKTDLAELKETGLKRLDWMLQMGTTTIEAKSGYGLDLATEIKQLRASQ
ncbi:MAG: amidohydrolase family protein, partial [Firmicutes bacterium]|nr:amidohydrolase family protein [Bacillota bacterium]